MRSHLKQIVLLLALLRPACDAIAQDSFIPEAPSETRDDLLKRITQRIPVMGLAMAQDGVLASAGDVLRVWDGINGGSLISLVGLYPTPYRAAAFSPDGTSVVGLSLEGEMNAWAIPLRFKASYIDRQESAARGQNKAHYGAQANALVYSPDGRILVSAASDTHPIKIWNADTGALIRSIDPPGVTSVTALAFSPDGAFLAFGTQHDLVFLKTSDWSVSRTIKAHDDWINAIAFAADGKTVASASEDKSARLWKTDTGEPVATLSGHTQAVRGIAVSPDGDLIATASLDKTVRIWRRSDASLVGTINHPRPVYAVAFTEPGTELATGSADNTVRLWRVPDWKLTQRMTGPEESVGTRYLFEADEPAVDTSESPLAFQPSSMKDVPPKLTDGAPPRDLAFSAVSFCEYCKRVRFNSWRHSSSRLDSKSMGRPFFRIAKPCRPASSTPTACGVFSAITSSSVPIQPKWTFSDSNRCRKSFEAKARRPEHRCWKVRQVLVMRTPQPSSSTGGLIPRRTD